MQYQTYREQRFRLESGVAEVGCKQVVQARLKGARMRWSEAGSGGDDAPAGGGVQQRLHRLSRCRAAGHVFLMTSARIRHNTGRS
jgi:hypothetical protein